MVGRPKAVLVVSDADRATLTRWTARRTTAQALGPPGAHHSAVCHGRVECGRGDRARDWRPDRLGSMRVAVLAPATTAADTLLSTSMQRHSCRFTRFNGRGAQRDRGTSPQAFTTSLNPLSWRRTSSPTAAGISKPPGIKFAWRSVTICSALARSTFCSLAAT